jgi:outer membrane protein TolC
MVKKILFVIFLLPTILNAQEVQQGVENMQVLFDSLKVNPQYKSNEIIMEKALLNKSLANSMLFPKIDAFGKYDYANTPVGMMPIAPNDMMAMVKDQNVAQPFSQNIFRVGVGFSMPIFVKSIFTMAEKAKMMYQSAEVKADIDLLKNEAIIVSSNANLIYIESLDKALDKKRESLKTVEEIVEIKVKNGRAPESALLKIKNGINNIDLTRAQIALNRAKSISTIQTLTGLKLDSAVVMIQVNNYTSGDLKVLEPMERKVEATKLGVRAEKEKLYPALVLNGNYNHAYANAYNNDGVVNTDFATVGVTLKIPLFERDQYKKMKIEKINVVEQQNELDRMRLEFSAQASQLENSLAIIINSEELYRQSILDKEELLNIAKVSYKSDRMSIEDYLKYEDDLILEKSNLYKIEAQKWQTLMKLAVIYGNNIEEIVK